MTRREKIVSELGLNEIVQESIKRHPRFADKRVGFIDGAEWMQKKMIDKLRELKYGYEHDLDVEPRVYERDIQLCAKLSLIEKLIIELEEE